MFQSARFVSLALLGLSLLGPASAAQQIDALTPPQLGAPERLRIDGLDFFANGSKQKAFKVRLNPVAGGKARKAKLISADPSRLYVQVPKIPAGEYAVEVWLPGASAPLLAPDPLVVRTPQLMAAQHEAVFESSEAGVYGMFLGEKRGKLWLGGKRARVRDWTLVVNPFGEQPPTLNYVRYDVPRGLGVGPHDLRLRNGIGEDELAAQLPCVDPVLKHKPGKRQMVARLNGQGLPKKLRSDKFALLGWTPVEIDPADPLPSAAMQAGPVVETPSPSASWSAAQLEQLLSPVLGSAADSETITTLFATARKGKKVRAVALALPGYEPELEAALLGEDALLLGATVIVLDMRLVGDEVFVETAWSGPASSAQLTHGPYGRLSAVFAAEDMVLLLGSGAATVTLEEAVIAGATQTSL